MVFDAREATGILKVIDGEMPLQEWLKPKLSEWTQQLYNEHLWQITEIHILKDDMLIYLQSIFSPCRAILQIQYHDKPYMISECCYDVFVLGYCNR